MTREEKWDRRFLSLAELIAQWSKDPSTKIGAVIVRPDTRVVVGMGYNGFPRGVEDSPERYADRDLKLSLVVHAEVNAILNATTPLGGCTMYVYPTLMIPNVCPDCAKHVVQVGITTLVCYNGTTTERWQKLAAISATILTEGGVQVRML